MTPPAGEQNPFGREILSDDLVRGLKQINPRIQTWEEHTSDVWYPNKGRVSCLWIGDPGGASRKLAAYPLGPIPEFTQIAPGSDEVLLMGWQEIFADVVASGVVSQQAIERKFKVDLTVDQKDTACAQCRRFGKVRQADVDGLCRAHWSVQRISKRMRTASKERK